MSEVSYFNEFLIVVGLQSGNTTNLFSATVDKKNRSGSFTKSSKSPASYRTSFSEHKPNLIAEQQKIMKLLTTHKTDIEVEKDVLKLISDSDALKNSILDQLLSSKKYAAVHQKADSAGSSRPEANDIPEKPTAVRVSVKEIHTVAKRGFRPSKSYWSVTTQYFRVCRALIEEYKITEAKLLLKNPEDKKELEQNDEEKEEPVPLEVSFDAQIVTNYF